MNQYGAYYYDHYSRYLGEPIDREVYEAEENSRSIQILKYSNVFQDCITYATLGLTHYKAVLQKKIEVVLAAADVSSEIGFILANALFYCIANRIAMGRGVSVNGIESISPEFVKKYGKSALYFTEPYAFPEGFETISADGQQDGTMLLAMFITEREHQYFLENGAEELEDYLECKDIDPFHIARTESLI